MKSKYIILILSSVFLVSCGWFERQDHDVTKPEIPTFRLYGQICKMSTGEGVNNLELMLYQLESYDGAWIDQTIIYTDQDGYYEFEDVPRGKFLLYIYENEETLLETAVVGIINYDHKELNITLQL